MASTIYTPTEHSLFILHTPLIRLFSKNNRRELLIDAPCAWRLALSPERFELVFIILGFGVTTCLFRTPKFPSPRS